MGELQKTFEKSREQTGKKNLKMKKKENKESRETQITTISVFGLTFHIKNYILLENIV